ncbi:hypothetical protein BD311DRAFT_767662 [Dichomitus squalens]|uniref:DUF8212 domain-containing protein n=1 Tax=Dichomitus squalens TaxID=114155 RepID=A0A4Q9M9Y4_9APHY|nr:hypothetical protein BD311DRAFT_767662 [Dichomitus squalens]
MYAWYQGAAMCYALLDDVPNLKEEDPRSPASSFRRSRWHKRGWTLQELIAPHSVIFLSRDWEVIGSKRTLADLIEEVTGIDRRVLMHKRKVEDVSVACRMSWAARRETKRIEDQAYCLMGIFGVYMPTIYGEGRHAFIRLQEEIIRKSPDQSIFAWGCILDDYHSGAFVTSAKEHDYAPQSNVETLLASSPADFSGCTDIIPVSQRSLCDRLGVGETSPEYTKSSLGIRTTFPLISITRTSFVHAALALLACEDKQRRIVALYLRSHPRSTMSNQFRVGGYIAQGGRRNPYYRATRLSVFEHSDLAVTAKIRQPSGKYARILVQPELKEVHIHSHDGTFSVGTPRSAISSSSSPRSSMVFFEPPCTIVLSPRSVQRLRDLGYLLPEIPSKGFRLDAPGDYRTVSFLAYESFTVHIGVCPLDLSSSTQKAQLWATVRFDSELGTILDDYVAKAGSSKPIGAPEREPDVIPEESMLVQSWKDGRCTFGSKGRQVRLAFSYPCADGLELDKKVSEVYELDIRFEGFYRHQGRIALERKGTISTEVTARSGGKQVAQRTFTT